MLRQEGRLINHQAVVRHMREMGLAAIYLGPNLSKRAAQQAIYLYLLRGVVAHRPTDGWGVDITSIRTRHSWLYLVAVRDWYSRYIVSWELDQPLALPFVLAWARAALQQATPTIGNSDQGRHFTSAAYISLLREAGVRLSLDGRGRALDNSVTERLWCSIKYEGAPVKGLNASEIVRSNLAS